MGYVIDYGCGTGVKATIKKKGRLMPVIAGVLCLALTILLLIPGVRTSLLDIILPGDGAVTAKALQNLASNLQAGEGWTDSVTVFCHEILAESGQ